MARMRRKFADRRLPIHEIMAESSAGLARQRAKTRETADRKAYGLANLFARRMQNQPKTSWPGGMERYQHANHPLNEASAWPASGSDRMDSSFMGKFGMTGGPNLYSGNYPMYPTWTGGMGTIGSQGYPDYGALQYKWGYPTDMLETGRTAAEQSANFPLGEFSGMDFPPRPIEDDPTLPAFLTPGTGVDSSVLPPMITPGTGMDSSALPDFLTPGTGSRPYDGTPSGVGEFGSTTTEKPEPGMLQKILERAKKLGVLPFGNVGKAYGALHPTGFSRGGIMNLKR